MSIHRSTPPHSQEKWTDQADKVGKPLWTVFCNGNPALQALDSAAMHQRRIHHADSWEYAMRERCGSMKLAVYEHVLALNAGFEQVRRALSALGRCRGLDRSELQRFSDEAKRIRAAAMSHMASVIEAAETDEAGQRFRKNVARERKEQKCD